VPEDGVLAAAFFPLAAGVRDAAATFLRRAAGEGGAYVAFHARVGAYAFHGEREALEVFETAVWGLLERAHKEPALRGDALVEAAFGALNASPHCGKNVGKVRRCAWDPGFVGVVLRIGCMRRVTRAFAAGAFRDGNTRHGGIGISAARPGGVNEDAFFTQGAALFCDKCPAAVAREFAEETLHVHNATTREPVWTSTGVSGERAAKVLFPRRRAWGFHKNWNYGKHAARRRAWEKAGGGDPYR